MLAMLIFSKKANMGKFALATHKWDWFEIYENSLPMQNFYLKTSKGKQNIGTLVARRGSIFDLWLATEHITYKKKHGKAKLGYIMRTTALYSLYDKWPAPVLSWRLARLFVMQNIGYLMREYIDKVLLEKIGVII